MQRRLANAPPPQPPQIQRRDRPRGQADSEPPTTSPTRLPTSFGPGVRDRTTSGVQFSKVGIQFLWTPDRGRVCMYVCVCVCVCMIVCVCVCVCVCVYLQSWPG